MRKELKKQIIKLIKAKRLRVHRICQKILNSGPQSLGKVHAWVDLK